MSREPDFIYGDPWWRWDLDDGIVVVDTPSGLMKRSAFRDADFVIDNRDVLGIALTLREDYTTSLETAGRTDTSTTRVGEFAILAPGQPTSVHLEGDARFLLLGLSLAAIKTDLANNFELDLSEVEFLTRFGQRDGRIERALFQLALADEEEAPEAALAVASGLVLRHSAWAGTQIAIHRAGIGPAGLRRVLDRVEDELTGSLPLPELARTAGLSPFHFAREFHRSTGFAPHQYVVRRRIARVFRLLAESNRSVEEVARQVGFHRGSHLARHLRQQLGVTPAQLRRLLR